MRSASSLQAKAVTPKDFSKADLERLKTKLRPHEVQAWVEDVKLTLQAYHPASLDVVERSAAQAVEARLAGEEAEAKCIDLWAARNAINSLDHASDFVRRLMDKVRHERKEARSCVALLFKAVQETLAMGPEEGRMAWEKFKSKSFFTMGASMEQTECAAARFREEFLAMPQQYTCAPNAIFRSLLDHLPAQLTTQRLFWQDRLFESESTEAPLPWSFSQLSRLVAQTVMVGNDRATPMTVHAAWSGKGGATGGYKSHQDQKFKQGSAQSGKQDMYCWNCGSSGHMARLCKERCNRVA